MFVVETLSTGDFVDILLDALYTPKNTAVCDDTRVREIPNLNSGIASAAKKFAKRWRIDGIVLDIRQYVCVLCLADNAPDQPASPSEFFTEDKRRLARQTRQAGCRPPTRITTPDVVLLREKPCVPLSTDAIVIISNPASHALKC